MRRLALVLALLGVPASLRAQLPVPITTDRTSTAALDTFNPPPGVMTTVGITKLGFVNGVGVEVHEMSAPGIKPASGIAVEVVEGLRQRCVSRVDSDEIPGLLAAIDALLAGPANPSKQEGMVVRYSTKGHLAVSVMSDKGVRYFVQAGLESTCTSIIDRGDLLKIRAKIADATARLR